MMHISRTFTFYKRKDAQAEIVRTSEQREVAIKFGNKGFGKRPDVLKYNNDILELVKQGATSFHISEERWQNPLLLMTEMRKDDIDDIRTGWDLIIDVDFPVWEITKIITHSLIKALKENGVKSVSCKFSGNKGFHIGVPFEAFPDSVIVAGKQEETRLLFPDSTRRILAYIAHYIDNASNNFRLSSKILKVFYSKADKKQRALLDEFASVVCANCEWENKQKTKKSVDAKPDCPYCNKPMMQEGDILYCTNKGCGNYMQKIVPASQTKCPNCGSTEFVTKFNLAIDAALISTRHLYRSVYSFHEKSGLISIPVNTDKVLEFEKEAAELRNVNLAKLSRFLDSSKAKKGEAAKLITEAFDYKPIMDFSDEAGKKQYKDFDLPEEALSEETFPPCIKNILNGIEDGRKRSLFILVNYFTSIGWGYEQIGDLLHEWNKKNTEQLREVTIKGQLRYHKAQKKKMLPPNCDNKAYYLDFRVCSPDSFCPRIKNPAQYSKLKTRILLQNNRRGRRKKKEDKDKSADSKVVLTSGLTSSVSAKADTSSQAQMKEKKEQNKENETKTPADKKAS